MHIADVTAHFLVHLWEKSPHLHRVPGCQPSTFFLTLSTNNRIQGVCSVANFRGEKVMQTVLEGTTLLDLAFVFFFLNFSLSLFLSFFCLCFWTKVIQTFFVGDHPAWLGPSTIRGAGCLLISRISMFTKSFDPGPRPPAYIMGSPNILIW